MIEKRHIRTVVEEYLKDTDLFIIDIRVSSANKATVLIDRMEGGVIISECAKLSRHIENHIDREKEDFELQVSSPGLEMPFLIHEQYIKNQGKKVEVIDNSGMKQTGVLRNVTKGGFDIEAETGKRGRKSEITVISYNFDSVKSVKSVIEFK